MKTKRSVLIVLIVGGLLSLQAAFLIGQQPKVDQELSAYSQRLMTEVLSEPVAIRSDFREAINKASRNLVQSGKITRRESLRLRIAMLSPAFRQHAEELAVIQMYYSGDDGVPMTADGMVDVASIDWEGLIAFLERLIPIIVQLLEIFGGVK